MRAAALACAVIALLSSCSAEPITSRERDFVVAGHPAHGVEVLRRGATGRLLVQRELRLRDASGADADVVKILAEIEADGNIRSASFRREGARGRRYVELRRTPAGALELVSRGNDEIIPIGVRRVRVLELAEHQAGAFDLEVEIASGAFANGEPLDDVATPAHRAPSPFMESSAPAVITWCKQQSAQPEGAAAAREVLLAVRPKLAPELAGGPPSALNALTVGGWDEAGSALGAACLRVLGHAARVVSGTVAGAPRTWLQVHDGVRFVDVDPLDARGERVATRVGFRDVYFGRTR